MEGEANEVDEEEEEDEEFSGREELDPNSSLMLGTDDETVEPVRVTRLIIIKRRAHVHGQIL